MWNCGCVVDVRMYGCAVVRLPTDPFLSSAPSVLEGPPIPLLSSPSLVVVPPSAFQHLSPEDPLTSEDVDAAVATLFRRASSLLHANHQSTFPAQVPELAPSVAQARRVPYVPYVPLSFVPKSWFSDLLTLRKLLALIPLHVSLLRRSVLFPSISFCFNFSHPPFLFLTVVEQVGLPLPLLQ